MRASDIQSAVTALEARVPLGISGLRLRRKVLGFGAIEPLEEPKLKPGQNILIYCEPIGLRFETRADASVVRLSLRIELISWLAMDARSGNRIPARPQATSSAAAVAIAS